MKAGIMMNIDISVNKYDFNSSFYLFWCTVACKTLISNQRSLVSWVYI